VEILGSSKRLQFYMESWICFQPSDEQARFFSNESIKSFANKNAFSAYLNASLIPFSASDAFPIKRPEWTACDL
jgi:hypothetical protein